MRIVAVGPTHGESDARLTDRRAPEPNYTGSVFAKSGTAFGWAAIGAVILLGPARD